MLSILVWFGLVLLGLIVGIKWDASPKIRSDICKDSYCIQCKTLRRKYGGRWYYTETHKVSMNLSVYKDL